MKKIIYLKLLIIFLLFPFLCSADMIAPLSFVSESIYYGIFSGGIFLLMMWVAEAYAIKVNLKDNTKKPLKVSLVANTITTLMGIVYFVLLGYFVIPLLNTSISFLFFILILPFCITFYTELCVLKKYYRTYPYKKLITASLDMNLTTYFLFFFLVLTTVDELGILVLLTPILSYYLIRLFEILSFEKDLKKYQRYIYSALIVIITFAIMLAVTFGPLVPPKKHNSARERAYDASIKGNLAGAHTNAELYYDNNSNSYKGLCSDSKIEETKQKIIQKSETLYLCQDSDQKYCISAQLPSSIRYTAKYFCVDSTGDATTTLHNYCTDGNYSCSGK